MFHSISALDTSCNPLLWLLRWTLITWCSDFQFHGTKSQKQAGMQEYRAECSCSILGSVGFQKSFCSSVTTNNACEFTWGLRGEQAATAAPWYPGQRAGSLPGRASPGLWASPGRGGRSWSSWRTSRGRSGPPESLALRAGSSGSSRPGEESAGWTQQQEGRGGGDM